MQIIKLDATDSTNAYLKALMQSVTLEDFTTVIANSQLNGRGQIGALWQSEKGKNLTFSVLRKNKGLVMGNQFQLNICVSLAIATVLKNEQVPDVSIKWPNDILSGSSKICGILIENTLLGDKIQASVIGIGLNVNQLTFNNLSNASSLKLLLGQTFNLDELLHRILAELKSKFFEMEASRMNVLWKSYENLLFRRNRPSTFKDKDGQMFTGLIRGVSPEGRLIVTLEDEILKEFNLKEIQLMY